MKCSTWIWSADLAAGACCLGLHEEALTLVVMPLLLKNAGENS